jgi:hypothetical protein
MIAVSVNLIYDKLNKNIMVLYPENKGLKYHSYYTFIDDHYLVKKTISEIFFDINFQVYLFQTYHHEYNKNVLFEFEIVFNKENEMSKFIRKNKIRSLLKL